MWWSALAGRLEQARRLDPVADRVGDVVSAVLPSGPVKDALHGRPLGHPLHPLLVALPIGTWAGALLLDLTGGEQDRGAARRLVGAGVLAAVPTAAFGLADWSEVGEFRRPKRVGLVHAAANAATTAAFAASWLARRRGDHGRGRDLALLGSAGLAVGGYLGGHLAYAEGVGVNRNADERVTPRDWTDACGVDDVAGDPVRLTVKGQAVVLVRTPAGIAGMGATCSHYGGPLDEGAVEDGCLVCPWHGSRFRLVDGSVARGPATAPQRSYDVRVVGDRVQVRARP